MTRTIFAALAAGALLVGCAMPIATMPKRQDPFAGLGLPQAQGGHPELSIAVVASANTQATVDFGHKVLAGSATDKWLKQEFELLQRNFGKVVHAASLPEAWGAGVDLVAVLDVYDQTWTSCKYEETLVFLAPGSAELDRVKAATDIPFRGPLSTNKVLAECIEDVQGQIERGIRSSKALREFAQRKSSGAPAAAKGKGEPEPPGRLQQPSKQTVAGAAAPRDFPKIAVWDLSARETKAAYAQELTSILVSEIARMKKHEVYSQENIRTLAGWTEERMKLGCTSTQCLTALGQMDVAKLISGSIGKIGDTYSISLNLFDTQNARAENALSEFCGSENELIGVLQRAVRKLLAEQ